MEDDVEDVIIETVPYNADNYCYLIHHLPTKATALVDCGDGGAVIGHLERRGWRLESILLTHYHYDHTEGVDRLLSVFPDTTVYKPEGERRIDLPSVAVGDGARIPFGSLAFEAVRVPAHTNCCTNYSLEGALFTSDTLFSAGCGRLFEGSHADLERAMARIAAFPPATLVYFGHEYTLANLDFALSLEPDNPDIIEYQQQCRERRQRGEFTTPTTIARELKVNPFLRIDHRKVVSFVDPEGIHGRVERIGLLRYAKDRF